MNETAQKAKPLGSVITVVANIVLCEPAVGRQEFREASRLRKEVGRMAQLRRLHDYRSLEIKDVLRPKEVKTAGASAKLPVIESVIVGSLDNQDDIEIGRHTERSAEFF